MYNSSQYTLRRCKKTKDKRYGPYHASDDGYSILCNPLQVIDNAWWIETNNYAGIVTCKKCLEVLKNRTPIDTKKYHDCVTHHHACACREELMLLICRQLVKEHNELKKLTSGFGKAEMCHCPACEAAIRLYGEKTLLEEKDDTQ